MRQSSDKRTRSAARHAGERSEMNDRTTQAIDLDPDVLRAVEERLAPGESVEDAVNRLLRVELGSPAKP
jgi:hypothetical protein